MEKDLHAIQSQEKGPLLNAWRVALKRHLIITAIYVATVLAWIYMSFDMPLALKVSGLVCLILLFTTFMIVDLRKLIDPFFPEGGAAKSEVETSASLAGMDDREKFISDWEEFIAKREAKEQQLESEFKPDQIDCYPVNIWDDFADGEETYAYVEDRRVPMEVKFKILNHLMQFAETLDMVKEGRVSLLIFFNDSALKYPLLVGNSEAEYCLYRRWELKISCPNHEVLDEFVEQLAKVPDFQGKKIDVYSES
ncbi:hypothetical protein CL689_02710 [Candidatus Saccharibacteria bacterium]|nr:hypothetical protein [Candidatus Saccharibacteria bacterium]|tara:strand:- start:6336 stop:7091 length:756 start_codon:yes stop_codon:yes gene_type:complete